MEALDQLRQAYKGEEFDYSLLMSYLKDYAKPRDKISRYLKDGSIIRVKKGLYVFGDSYRRQLVSLEVLANLIYGPSYLSLEYALSYYGLIPEKVSRLTSMTTQRTKAFKTPLGYFSYQHLPLDYYTVGIRQQTIDATRHFLIASPEKALADLLVCQSTFDTKTSLGDFLIENLRLNEKQLWKLNLSHFNEILKVKQHRSLQLLKTLIQDNR